MATPIESQLSINLSDWLTCHYPADLHRIASELQSLHNQRHAIGYSIPLASIALEAIDWHVALPAKIQRSVAERQHSYIAGRLCAEQALSHFGWHGFALHSGSMGEPIWPSGLLGSITHTPHKAYALVCRKIALQGIGIDCEPLISLAQAVAVVEICCNRAEQQRWFSSYIDPLYATLIFSAKEAAYKAIAPQVARVIDFTEFEVMQINMQQQQLLLQPCDLIDWPVALHQIKIQFDIEYVAGKISAIYSYAEY